MKYRLDAQHYINDRLLEPGHIIGEGTDVPFIDRHGHPLRPSRSMTPLDADAAAAFKKAFPGAELPDRDPLASIPIQGTGDPVKTGGPGNWVIGPDGKPTGEQKKGLPDSGSPNHPVGQPVIGTEPQPGTTPSVPPKSADDHGQPPGAPLKVQQAPQPAQSTNGKK